mgnify:CR=1 FL=1
MYDLWDGEGGKGRVWKTKEGIMKTSGIVDRGEDTIRNVEKVEQKRALTPVSYTHLTLPTT